MTKQPLIGIVGGYGAVGRAAARRVKTWRLGRLRIGGRTLAHAERFCREELGQLGEPRAVDYADEAALARFCEGCHVVVNCAGPSYRILDTVARAALAHGADYVDSYGDDPVYERLAKQNLAGQGRRALLSAGILPGVAGMLPRWLARRGFDRPQRLTAYVGGLERVTPAAAADYLLSLGSGFGESLAAWRHGRRVSKALSPMYSAKIPFFPGLVTAYPYLSAEAERVSRELRLGEASWYNVFDGTEGLAALNRLQAKMQAGADLVASAAELARAAELDLFGRTRYQILLFELHGEQAGRSVTRTLVLSAPDGSELSGTVTALAIAAVLRRDVEAGVHYTASVLDPDDFVDRLRGSPAVQSLDLVEGAAEEAVEEGSV